MSKALFIYRRDLRTQDNTALNAAAEKYQEVYPVFFIDPRQQKGQNEYFSQRAFNYMLNRLSKMKITILEGLPHVIIDELCKKVKYDACYCNMDYTPFSQSRDRLIAKVLEKYKVTFVQMHDYCLNPPDMSSNYRIFTAYYNYCKQKPVNKPRTVKINIKLISNEKNSLKKEEYKKTMPDEVKEVLERIKHADHSDDLAKETSMSSAAIKFGIISIREAYYASKNDEFKRQLYWRDFFTQLAYYNPHVLIGPDRNFRQYDFKWNNSNFDKWAKAQTDEDIVNAGIKQLLQTGFMHNRARLIVANYLVHKLNVNWELGEKFFAQNLIDYDPCVNNGNWQYMTPAGTNFKGWIAYNPELQKKKYDPDGTYRKKYC